MFSYILSTALIRRFPVQSAAFAMYRAARQEKKKQVGGLLLSAALTSMIICNTDDYSSVSSAGSGRISAGEPILRIQCKQENL